MNAFYLLNAANVHEKAAARRSLAFELSNAFGTIDTQCCPGRVALEVD